MGLVRCFATVEKEQEPGEYAIGQLVHCETDLIVLPGRDVGTEESQVLSRSAIIPPRRQAASPVSEGLFGSGDDIVLDVGRRLLATRHVPTLIEL